MEAKPRASIEVRKAIPDLRSHVMPWEKPSSLSSRHVSGTKAPLGSNSFSVYGGDRESDLPRNQCLNPPFVISAAMHPEGSRLAVGLGDGCLAVFDYASTFKDASDRNKLIHSLSQRPSGVSEGAYVRNDSSGFCELLLLWRDKNLHTSICIVMCFPSVSPNVPSLASFKTLRFVVYLQ